MKKILTILILLSLQSKATDYYVSNGGSDANSGLSTAAPWLTINKVNISAFSAGDRIFFRRGNVWREQLTVPSNGSAGSLITFGAYDAGARPIINGANVTTGWTNAGSNQWWVNNPNATTTRAMVIIGGTIFAEVATLAEVNSASEYFIDVAATPDRIYVFSTVDPATPGAEISNRNYCILVNAKHHIKIENIEVRFAGNSGISFENTVDGQSIVDGCYIYANRLHGVVARDGYDNTIFRNSTAEYNGNGFYAWDNADGITMQQCTTQHQIQYVVSPNNSDGGGLQCFRSTDWLVENCYSNDDADGIHIDAGSTAADFIMRYNKCFNAKSDIGYGVGSVTTGGLGQIYYNLSVTNADSDIGAFTTMTGTIQVYNNTFISNTTSGTDATAYLTNGANWVFKNNLFVRDFMASQKSNFIVVGTAMSTNDYNCYYILDNTGNTMRNHYNGAFYSSIAAWRTGVSQDANGISADPLFVNETSDWSLQSTSPCINAGVSVGLTRDINGTLIVGAPDIGAYEFNPLMCFELFNNIYYAVR